MCRNQLNSFIVGTAEKTHQSTLLTEMAQLMTGCQAHQNLLSAFAKWLNMKSKSTQEMRFCQQLSKSTPS